MPVDPSAAPLHIVEPTLVSEAGHCHMLLHSLRAAAPALRFELWAGREWSSRAGAAVPWSDTTVHRHFSRRWRRLQALWLYRRLLRGGEPFLVPTAGRFDLEAIRRVAPGPVPPNRVFLYFHKLSLSPSKEAALRRVAQSQPELVTLGTTEIIESRLQSLGFRNTGVMLPLPPRPGPAARPQPFRRIVVAGAARADKGFAHVVDLIERLAAGAAGSPGWPIAVQLSGDHYARHDPVTRAALQRLAAVQYPPLQRLPQTLPSDDFLTLFDGALCLQPYEPSEYADKVSAVTLDALNAAAPIVTVEGTWMAAIARRHGCGVVAPTTSADDLLAAIRTALERYPELAEAAARAAARFASQENWAPLLRRLQAG